MDQELTKYKNFLLLSGIRESTIEDKLTRFNCLLKNVEVYSPTEVMGFLVKLKEKGRTGRYLNHFVIDLRLYYTYLNLPITELRKFKSEETMKEILSEEELKKFLNIKPNKYHKRDLDTFNRWGLFFKIMVYCGMRPGEVANLRVEDLDFGRKVFVLKQTKTLPRLVPMPPILFSSLSSGLKMAQNGYLFYSQKGNGPYRKEAWQDQFKSRIKLIGVTRPVTCHSLRASFITRMSDDDLNVGFYNLQKIVGHRKAETTLGYRKYTTKDIEKAIRKDPLGRKGVVPEDIAKQIAEYIKNYHLEKYKKLQFSLTEGTNELRFDLKWK